MLTHGLEQRIFVMSHGTEQAWLGVMAEERPSVGSFAPAAGAEVAMPTPPEFPPAQGLPFPFCGVPGAAWNWGQWLPMAQSDVELLRWGKSMNMKL